MPRRQQAIFGSKSVALTEQVFHYIPKGRVAPAVVKDDEVRGGLAQTKAAAKGAQTLLRICRVGSPDARLSGRRRHCDVDDGAVPVRLRLGEDGAVEDVLGAKVGIFAAVKVAS